MTPPIEKQLLDRLVRQIVEAVRPLRIVLFGSAARGHIGPHSDLDLLVVMPDGVHRRQTAHTIYRRLLGVGVAKDVIVVAESDVRDDSNNPPLVLYPALANASLSTSTRSGTRASLDASPVVGAAAPRSLPRGAARPALARPLRPPLPARLRVNAPPSFYLLSRAPWGHRMKTCGRRCSS